MTNQPDGVRPGDLQNRVDGERGLIFPGGGPPTQEERVRTLTDFLKDNRSNFIFGFKKTFRSSFKLLKECASDTASTAARVGSIGKNALGVFVVLDIHAGLSAIPGILLSLQDHLHEEFIEGIVLGLIGFVSTCGYAIDDTLTFLSSASALIPEIVAAVQLLLATAPDVAALILQAFETCKDFFVGGIDTILQQAPLLKEILEGVGEFISDVALPTVVILMACGVVVDTYKIVSRTLFFHEFASKMKRIPESCEEDEFEGAVQDLKEFLAEHLETADFLGDQRERKIRNSLNKLLPDLRKLERNMQQDLAEGFSSPTHISLLRLIRHVEQNEIEELQAWRGGALQLLINDINDPKATRVLDKLQETLTGPVDLTKKRHLLSVTDKKIVGMMEALSTHLGQFAELSPESVQPATQAAKEQFADIKTVWTHKNILDLTTLALDTASTAGAAIGLVVPVSGIFSAAVGVSKGVTKAIVRPFIREGLKKNNMLGIRSLNEPTLLTARV